MAKETSNLSISETAMRILLLPRWPNEKDGFIKFDNPRYEQRADVFLRRKNEKLKIS